ncbi:hypothetical protein Taro_023447 [Colocasia esculenta]|uniref:Uncharacterized protein n=1 Tax=Colocasia esculenta TaxID=4460 RepID=A0A843VEI5_COLES|nr:hypothetical protein [Colocasia esculenta]
MLPSLVCACVWFVGDPGIEDPVGLPPCWCCDRTVRRDISRGVAPVGRDLIAAHLAVATRIGGCHDALPRRIRVRVAAPFPVAMVSRRPVGARQCLWVPRVFPWPGCVSACAPGQALPLGPSGRERGRLPPCVQ